MTNELFSSLKLPQALLENLKQLGFDSMTPIQAQSLPTILQNKDVIAQAKTGSGKTVAFGIGVLNKLNVKQFKVQALVLCPTRELASQVAEDIRRLARFTSNIKVLTLCGGQGLGPQFASLRHGAHVIVGTPGRVLKHLEQRALNPQQINTLVLDEADRMLDMGFIDEIKKIIQPIPHNRQTLLFSATYNDNVIKLGASLQRDACQIKSTDHEVANKVGEYFFDVIPGEKLPTMIKLFNHHQPQNVIIFSNTKVEANKIAKALKSKGIEALALHGDLEQTQRNDILIKFSNASCAVLVATDVAARGLDIKNLSMVINYQLPHDEQTYTHRIGRTARAGSEGIAITLCSGQETLKAEGYNDISRDLIDATTLSTQQQTSLEAPNATLVIEGGKKDKIRPGDILGALCGDADIKSQYIGNINVFDRQSYVAIQRPWITQAYQGLKQGKIKARKFSVWLLK